MSHCSYAYESKRTKNSLSDSSYVIVTSMTTVRNTWNRRYLC